MSLLKNVVVRRLRRSGLATPLHQVQWRETLSLHPRHVLYQSSVSGVPGTGVLLWSREGVILLLLTALYLVRTMI